MRIRIVVAVPFLALALVPGVASAQGADFGAPGQIVISTAASMGVASTQFDHTATTRLSAFVAPAFDAFVVRDVSLGLDVGATYGKTTGEIAETTSTTLFAGARLGVVVHLGDRVSWWPRLEVGYESDRFDERITAPAGQFPLPITRTIARSGPYANLFLPLLVHLAPHFYVGAGPSISHEFTSSDSPPALSGNRTTIGGGFTAGGYVGGAETSPSIAPAEPVGRFGEMGQLVLTGDITDTAVSWTSFEQSDASRFGLTLEPGLDYFAADHLSLGISGYAAHSDATVINNFGGGTIKATTTTFELRARIGGDLPLASWLSLWPRAFVGVGTTSDENAGSNFDVTTIRTIVEIGGFAPLLVHPAPHFFVGFGPTVAHAIEASDQNGHENRGTTVGASLVVGGWIATADARRAP